MAGFAVLIYTNGYSANTTLLNHSSETTANFDKTGAYSVVRHPLCNGLLIMWLGPAILTGNLFFIVSFILFCCVFFERIMIAEEAHFKRKFGFKYSVWAEEVPALIPNLSKLRKPDKKFNLTRAFKNSTGQLSIVMLTFFLLDGLKQILAVKPDYNDLYIAMLLLSVLITAAGELDYSLKRKKPGKHHKS